MFERYTEHARRVIFFARYEAQQFGSPEIESEHLLLGLLREGREMLNSVLELGGAAEEIRRDIERASKKHAKPVGIDLPLTSECKRILAYGAEEAERLAVKYIDMEHLALGILREEKCLAARILKDRGLNLKRARSLVGAQERLSTPKFQTDVHAAGQMAGSAAGFLAGSAIEVRIVDAVTAKSLFSFRTRGHIPRIGESLQLGGTGISTAAWRVQDVVWLLQNSSIKEIQVRVIKEATA